MDDFLNNTDEITLKHSIFRIGCVFSVEGREVRIRVDKRKNSSHLLYKGNLLKNVSVGGYIKIVKGFISIIAKVEGEYIKEEKIKDIGYSKSEDKIDRILRVQLLGFIENSKFERGIKELPLIDNECFLLDEGEFNVIHDFVDSKDHKLKLGTLALDRSQDIYLGVNSLFASHIGIFGNTGSGKSYTLAKLYRLLFEEFKDQSSFNANAKFVLFDFNGEYNEANSIITEKKVYNLSTKGGKKDRIPFLEKDILNFELFSIMASATEKTQQPFIRRTLKLYEKLHKESDPLTYFKNILRKKIIDILSMSDKIRAYLLLDYVRAIFTSNQEFSHTDGDLTSDFTWHGQKSTFCKAPNENFDYFDQKPELIKNTKIYGAVDNFQFAKNHIGKIIAFLYVQLITDIFSNRAQNEHIAGVINKLKSFEKDIENVISVNSDEAIDFWAGKVLVVINLNDVNIDMKKLIPLLISYKLYSEHKQNRKKDLSKSLNIIIDEAHNILSFTSQRESETWKDYRLETFEEIVKEGRKFGVFLTIASQRPSDISATIVSQLHNYFIHRLINEKDIEAVGRTISYLDKVSHESLPILPTGTCVLAGLSATVPVIVSIDEIEKKHEPHNKTINLVSNWLDSIYLKQVPANDMLAQLKAKFAIDITTNDSPSSANTSSPVEEDDLPF